MKSIEGDFKIEAMKKEDWEMVSAIYLEGIQTGIATFQADLPTWEEWDKGHIQSCRFVARREAVVMGWVALSHTSSRRVYAGVAEVSIYIGEAFKGLGVGTALLNEVAHQSEVEGFWTLQAGIIEENTASQKLHSKCGFRKIGIREKIAQMPNGRWHNVVLMERRRSE